MSLTNYSRVGDAEKNMHYRVLVEIIGVANRGIRARQDASPIKANYKIKLNPRDLNPIFYRDKILAYNCC